MRELDVPAIRRRLGDNMRRLRLAAELTQLQASERAGLELRHWQRVELADGNPTLTTIVRVAFGLGVDISVLFMSAPTHGSGSPADSAGARRRGRPVTRHASFDI